MISLCMSLAREDREFYKTPLVGIAEYGIPRILNCSLQTHWINKGDFNSERNFQMTNILIYLKGKILKINIFS